MRASFVLGLAAVLVVSCAYPRRSTSLSPVRGLAGTTLGPGGTPADVYRFTVVSATVPQRNRGATQWDDGGGLPDPVVRLYRDDELVWQTRTLNDTLQPEWNEEAPRNVRLPSSARIRLEVWDADELGGDPIGIWRGVGLPPQARPGIEARILLEGGSYLTIRVDLPQPHRGVGIRTFEVRDDRLIVIDVEPYSPAARADIVPGDSVIAIGNQTVAQMGSARASGALSMAAERQEALRVRNAQGIERTVMLDRGYVWLMM